MTCAEELTSLRTRRAAYIAAEAAILGGSQSYSIGNRTVTMADLEEISKQITRLCGQISQLERGNRISIQRIIPRDNV